MREVCLLNKGDSVDKVKYEYNLDVAIASSDKIINQSYVALSNGAKDVIVVRNYHPFYVYKVKNGENIFDIMSRGFDVGNVSQVEEGDIIILSRPKSIRYIVKPLENIADLANRFGVTKQYLMEVNKLTTEKLFIGQILWI